MAVMRVLTRLALVSLALAACTAPEGRDADNTPLEALDGSQLQWVSPLVEDVVAVGEPFEIAVWTQNADAHAVRFAIDGVEQGSCNATDANDDCHEDEIFHWSSTLDAAGPHTLTASFTTAGGRVVQATRAIEVVASPPSLANAPDEIDEPDVESPTEEGLGLDLSLEGDDGETNPAELTASDPDIEFAPDPEGTSTIVDAIRLAHDHARGYLDPSHGYRQFEGSIEWRVRSQRVLLRRAHIDGSASAACRCVRRYGDRIDRIADSFYVSRGSMAAAIVAGDNCDTDAGTVASHAFVRGRTCVQIARAGHQIIAPTATQTAEQVCRERMQTQPEFALGILASYLAMPAVQLRHRFDPPRIAAVIANGSVRKSHLNRWHMRAPNDWISRFVGAYNAYRYQESGGAPALPSTYDTQFNQRLRDAGGNRIANPHPVSMNHEVWPLAAPPGTVELKNAFGEVRGVIAGTGAQINYGQRRMIGGVAHVYAFAVSITPRDGTTPRCGGSTYGASGWIREDSLTPQAQADLRAMPTHPAPSASTTGTAYLVTGAPADHYYVSAAPACPAPAEFNDRRVRSYFTGGHVAASDYVVRDGNVINLLFSLAGRGGVATDTVPVSTAARPVRFVSASNVDPVAMPIYRPCAGTSDGTQTFVYGHVETPDGARWGWIDRANLTRM